GWEKRSVAQLMSAIDDYINWYNRQRIKMSLGGKSPIQYRVSLGLMSA
ncbi:MAG: IS3 family transposase, partial [Firmicutes bacterium]|nr:IS3 family transposase [Bacillota bacterium]